jgi:hypothetical protein
MSGGSKSTTTRTEPWAAQKPYLETGFERAEDLYKTGKLTPSYYGVDPVTGAIKKEPVAGFAGLQTEAQAAAEKYLKTGPGGRPGLMMAGAEREFGRGLTAGGEAMMYGGKAAAPLGVGDYAGMTPFSEAQYSGLLGGDYDPSKFDPVAAAIRAESVGKLESEILPGIRQQITQYQPGGGSKGDIVQANAIAAAQEDINRKISQGQFQAYQQAQQRMLPAAQLGVGQQQFGMGYGLQGQQGVEGMLGRYGETMAAPLRQYEALGGIGAQQQAQHQREIDADMARYGYGAELPGIGLQNYLAGISGDYGGTATSTGPAGPSPFVSALAGGLGMGLAGPAGTMFGKMFS